MKLKNILIVVNDIELAKKFYHDLFGLEVLLDSDGNVIMTEGLVLQDEKIWKVPVIQKSRIKYRTEYSVAAKPSVRKNGNHLSG